MTKESTTPLVKNDDGSLIILFPKSVYSLDAVKKASYKFTDSCSFLINEQNTAYEVLCKPTADIPSKALDELVNSFCNEVLDQDLRERIASETHAVRSLILAQAFSKTSLLEG